MGSLLLINVIMFYETFFPRWALLILGYPVIWMRDAFEGQLY